MERILKQKTYKIIDSDGKKLAGGYRNWQSGINDLGIYKLNKQDKLEVVEE